MKRIKLLWHIYPPMVLVTVLSLIAISWYASSSLREFFLDQTEGNLKISANFILKQVAGPFLDGDPERLRLLCRDIAGESSTRVTLILKSGEVVADSAEQWGKMDNHSDRAEVGRALAGKVGLSIRYSQTMQQDMLYVAVPISDGSAVAGVLRLSVPVTSIDEALQQVHGKILLSLVFLIIVAALVTLGVSRKISRPIEKIRHSAERFAKGDLTRKIVFGRDKSISLELMDLASAMNRMAGQLDERIRTVTEQRNELEAVFASMVEAVLVINMEECLVRANRAALSLLDIDETRLQGKPIVEVVRNPALLKFIRKSLSVSTLIEEELVLHEAGVREDLFFLARGKSLQDAQGVRVGCLVVFNDVTRLRRLEGVRSDFVANVSHELKTPITTIKGFVETLKDGALDDPVEARRFVDIILKNSNRLNDIVDDLLALARIEADDNSSRIELEHSLLRNVIAGSMETCASRAEAKNLAITIDCPDDLAADMNSPLLQQAVTNLIVNAIKYSHPGGEIKVTGRLAAQSILLRVEDFGVGIAAEHLPRLFERFYRSDKARSRQLGGTGLGLAIVKHIVHAHHGVVDVASIPGKGTVFTIKFPVAGQVS